MRTCQSGKRIYNTRRQAIRALDRIRAERARLPVVQLRLRDLDSFEQSAYRCPTCGGYHLSHYAHKPRIAA